MIFLAMSDQILTNTSQQRDFTSAFRFSFPLQIRAHRCILDPHRSLHLMSDRDPKRNHLRLHADTAPIVRDALMESEAASARQEHEQQMAKPPLYEASERMVRPC